MQKLAISILFLALGAGSMFAHRDAAPPIPGVRFVDLTRCIEEVPFAIREMEALRAEFAPILGELENKEKRLRAEEGELSVLSSDSSEYAERVYNLESSRLVLEREQKFYVQKYQMRKRDAWIQATRLIHEAAAGVGRQKGYASVMVQPFSLAEIPEDPAIAAEALQGRNLLWTHPEYDITQEVIDFLADEF